MKSMQNEELQDLKKTNCNKCVLQKRKLCPYLEEVAECHMFNDLKGPKVFKGINEEKHQSWVLSDGSCGDL